MIRQRTRSDVPFLTFTPRFDPVAVPRGTAQVLGTFRLGGQALAVDWPEQGIFARLPGLTADAVHEAWLVEGPVTSGTFDGIAWRRAGDVLFGVIDLDEAAFADGAEAPMQAASELAYRRIFALLDAQGLPALWRVWNYLSDINGEARGLERYRQFNVGRQDAFLACRRGSTGNVPAACALGLQLGPLSVAFLAGATPAVPVENPRQVSAYNYPAEYGPRSPTFSRAALVYPPGQEILFISGTASIVGHQTVHAGDVAGQTREALANVLAVLAEANRKRRSAEFLPETLVYRVYLRHLADYPQIHALLSAALPGAEVLYVEADVCRSDLLVEIEAMALHALEDAPC